MELKRKFTGKHANGVKQYHYETEPNQGMRKGMEDACFVHDRFLDNCSNSILFGVFDGHGGSKVSEYISKQFPAYFSREYKTAKKNAKTAFENTYSLLDQKIKNEMQQSTDMGSTATVGLILLEEAERVLYISHVGDSCAYLFDDKGGEKTTPEHRVSNLSQVQRIKQINQQLRKTGGSIMMGRVAGVLAVTRSFGDFSIKKFGVSAVPEVKRIELRLHHKYLIVASDGLWDYINSQEVVSIIKDDGQVDNITRSLIKKALKNGSTDNISVVCLRL